MKTSRFTLRNAMGVAGILFAGYVIVNSLSDLRRYIKISMM